MLAILCSGQGFQGPGMFDLVADAPAAAPVFAAAAAMLGGDDPRTVARRDDAHEIHRNATAQVLCCTQALAAWAVLGSRIDARLVVAGYSVGELAAWGVAGLFDAATVLTLAAERAAAMDEATRAPAGLVAVRGLTRLALDAICRRHDAHVAIVNAPDQMVIGGTREALDAASADAERAGAGRITPLPVNVASHTPVLAAAADAFGPVLERQRLGAPAPDRRLLSGIDGAPVFDTREGLRKLARQIGETVDWQACMDGCRSAGATRAIELGPGRALARLMGEVIGERRSRSLADFRTLDGALRWATAAD